MRTEITLKSNDLRETANLSEDVRESTLSDKDLVEDLPYCSLRFTHPYSDVWKWEIRSTREDAMDDAVFDIKNMIQEITSGYDVTIKTS